MAYTGNKPTNVVDVSETQALTVDGDLTISDKIVHSSDTNTAIRFAAADTVTVETGGSEAFRIDSSQNVGIGTTPASGVRLDIRNDSTTNIADLRNANSAGFGLYVAGGTGSSYYALRAADKDNNALFTVLGNGKVGIGTTTPENPIEIETANTLGSTFTGTTAGEGLRVTQSSYSDGNFVSLIEAPYQPNGVPNVRIGAEFTSSGSKLVFGTSNSFGAGITVRAASINHSGNIHIGRDTGTPTTSDPNGIKLENNGRIVNGRNVDGTGNILVCNGNAGLFRVMGNGDAQNTNNSYGSATDEKLKENISDASSQWDDIKAVRIRKYSLKERKLDAADSLGVIAQELEAAGMKGLVKEVEIDTDSEETVKTVKYSILYMKAVKALQEAMARIETLETKVAALEAE